MSGPEPDPDFQWPNVTLFNDTGGDDDDKFRLNLPYTVCEVLVAVCAVVGNALVILVFTRERRLRRRTNYYIISLATADLLVGLLGIPFAVLASVGLPENLYACLFTVSLLIVLCTISIFCLVAVSVDRYWAILHPMAYSRNVRTKTAIGIIGLCWFLGSVIGFLPLFGWHKGEMPAGRCLFTKVMDYNYLVFLYFATIIFPALVLAAFYAHIYQVVLKQLRQIVTMNPTPGAMGGRAPNGGTMLRVFGAAQKREVKATKNLSIIVFFFIVCWIPLYTINCIQAFCPDCPVSLTLTNCCIILSHLNSAGNPLLYAYHLRDFRAALKHLLCGMLGIKDDVTEYHGPRASLGSHAHHGTYSRNNSIQSLRESSHLMQLKANSLKLSGGAVAPSDISPRMWTVPEVSSCDEESGRIHSSLARLPPTPVRLRASTARRSDAKVNSTYTDDPMDLEMGDDDVFVESTTSETLPSSDVLDELPFRNCSLSSIWSRRSPRRSAATLDRVSLTEAQDMTDVDIDKMSSSPALNGNGDLSIFSSVNRPSPEKSEPETNKRKDSPLKQLTRSPLKFVGEFLFNATNKTNFLNDISGSDEPPRNGSVVIDSGNSTRVT